jgi:hypothetical protein
MGEYHVRLPSYSTRVPNRRYLLFAVRIFPMRCGERMMATAMAARCHWIRPEKEAVRRRCRTGDGGVEGYGERGLVSPRILNRSGRV